MAAAASTYWETVVEWREVISLNDQITTALGAFSTGEPWYQIGHYLAHQPGLLAQALSFLEPTVKLNHWLDRKEPDAKAYTQPGWRDLAVFGARGARLIRIPVCSRVGKHRLQLLLAPLHLPDPGKQALEFANDLLNQTNKTLPDLAGAQGLSGACVQFEQPVGEIAGHIKALAVGRNRQPGRDFGFAFGQTGRRQRQGVERGHLSLVADRQHLNITADIGKVDAPAVGREDEPGVAGGCLGVGVQDLFRHTGGLLAAELLRGQRHVLQNPAVPRTEQEDLILAARGQQLAVRAQRQDLRPHAGQLDLDSRRRKRLVYGDRDRVGVFRSLRRGGRRRRLITDSATGKDGEDGRDKERRYRSDHDSVCRQT